MSSAPVIPEDVDPATLDIISPEKYERDGYPHPEWTWLRKHDPVHWYESTFCDPFWAVTKHADIVAIGKNPKDWIIEPRLAVFTRDIPPEPTSHHLLTMDPPDHGRYRNLTAKWFTPSASARPWTSWKARCISEIRRLFTSSSLQNNC